MYWPVGRKWPITTQYGEDLGTRYGGIHYALDIGCPFGTPVYASAKGNVARSDTIQGGYCLTLTFADNSGLETRCCHLDGNRPLVIGDVEEGQIIAYSGDSGAWLKGEHLHFAMTKRGITVNPMMFEWTYNEEVKVSRSIMSIQIQNGNLVTKAFVDKVVDCGIQRVKCLDLDQFPNLWPSWMPITLRLWMDERDNAYVKEGRVGADKWWAEAWPRIQRVPQADIIEGANETPLKTVADATAANAFYERLCDLLTDVGKKCGVYNISEGNPEMWIVPYLVGALRKPNAVLDLHEYRMTWDAWNDSFNDGYHVGRVNKFMEEVYKTDPSANPSIYIGECGIDGPAGWRSVNGMTPEKFLDRMINQEAVYKASKLPITDMFLFVQFPWAGQWQTFDTETFLPVLFPYIKAMLEPQADKIMAVARPYVFPVNRGAALNKYILDIKGWSLDSVEFQAEGWTCEWAYDKVRNVRVLCRAQAPTWQVEEYKTEAN